MANITQISIANSGFEQQVLEDAAFGLVPGWETYNPSNLVGGGPATFNPRTVNYPNEAPEGSNVLAIFLPNPPGIGVVGVSQKLPQVLTADSQYTLTVEVGNNAPRADLPAFAGFPGYAVQLLAGGTTIAQDYNTLTPAEGTFATSTVKYTASANDPNLGKPLEIRLVNILQGEGIEVNFDRVQLQESKLPKNLFDEAYYLQSYADVAVAVRTGVYKSGLEHFYQFGRSEGRYLISPYFNEASYLRKYSDVAQAVAAKTFSSGLQHFLDLGENEGRSPDILEPNSGQIYLQKYIDVSGAIARGIFKSWYDHFIQFGLAEGRSPSYLNENDYLIYNPDVAQAVKDKKVKSGYDHLVRYGQFETSRIPLFSGTAGNDNITSFGVSTNITGVAVDTVSANPQDLKLRSTGVGEVDVLTGQATESDYFSIGVGSSPSNPNPTKFYVGQGDADYALVQNFVKGTDFIVLAGSNSDYIQQAVNGNLNIYTTQPNRDLVAIVQGLTSPLSVVGQDPSGFFLAG